MPRDLWSLPGSEAGRQNFDKSPWPVAETAGLVKLTKPREWPLLPSQATITAKARGMVTLTVSAKPWGAGEVVQFCTLSQRQETPLDKQRKLRGRQLRPLPMLGE